MDNIKVVLGASITARWEVLSVTPPEAVSQEEAVLLVEEDVGVLSAFAGDDWQYAVYLIGDNAIRHPAYLKALSEQSPFIAKESSKVVAKMNGLLEPKERRKAVEFESMKVEGKQQAMLRGLQALSDRNGILVFPEQVQIFKPVQVPESSVAYQSVSAEELDGIEMFRVAREAQRHAMPMACLIEEPGVRVFVVQEDSQDFRNAVGKPVVIYAGEDGVKKAVQLEPEVLKNELQKSAHLEIINRELSRQGSVVDGMTAALLSYAANSQVPPKEWLRCFEYERAKLAKIAGWRDVPDEELKRLKEPPQAEAASYGEITVSDESEKSLLRALGVEIINDSPLATTLHVRVTDSVYERLEPYRGEFNWELHGVSAELDEKVRGVEPLSGMGLDKEQVNAVLELLFYEQAKSPAGPWSGWWYERIQEAHSLLNEMEMDTSKTWPENGPAALDDSPQP